MKAGNSKSAIVAGFWIKTTIVNFACFALFVAHGFVKDAVGICTAEFGQVWQR
jgi:hypothetical protein